MARRNWASMRHSRRQEQPCCHWGIKLFCLPGALKPRWEVAKVEPPEVEKKAES